jgi:WD40 repeat protein
MADRNSSISPHLRLLYTLRGHEQEINRLAWSPDGRSLASASFDSTVRIWDTETGKLEHTLTGHNGAVYSVAWSPDGWLLASCSQDKRVLAWDVQDARYLSSPVGEQDGNVYDIAWLLYSSAFLASCSEDQSIQIWGIDPHIHSSKSVHILNSKPIHILRGHASAVYCLAHAPDRNTLASGSSRGPIRLWDASLTQMGMYVGELRSHTTAVYSMAWSPDGKLLASCSEDHTIRLWEAKIWASGEGNQHILERHTDAVTGVSFSHDGRLLASKSRDGTVCLWRADTWENIATIPAPASNGMFAGVAFHPHAPLLATLSERDRVICVWEVDIAALLGQAPARPSVHYANAKVVLVGESGVGKTALGLALTGQPFSETSSTHGRGSKSIPT